MNLELNLTNVLEDYRLPFCNFILKKLQEIITTLGEQPNYLNMEAYINSNHLIDWIANKNNIINIFDLYRLAVNNLEIKKVDNNIFIIELNNNINIPNSYTSLYSIISLLEYGTLSIKPLGVLTKYEEYIAKNLNIYYKQFLMEATK